MLASARPRLYYGWVIVVVALVMNIAASPTNAVAFSFFVAPMTWAGAAARSPSASAFALA